MTKTTKTTTKPLKKYTCKHCTQSKIGKEMKCLDKKYLCCLDCHEKRQKTKQPPRTYLCLGCGQEKSHGDMQYQKTKKGTGKGIGKCKDCFDGKKKLKKLKKYKCLICGEEKVWRDMHYTTDRASKCKACRNVRAGQPKTENKPTPKLAPKLTILPETRIVTLCQLCKTKKPIIDFEILPNCTRDKICKQCREEAVENNKAKLFKKPTCLYCHLPILHESDKVGAYHKKCKAKRNAAVV